MSAGADRSQMTIAVLQGVGPRLTADEIEDKLAPARCRQTVSG